jgi:hypothetical protein
MIGVPSEAGTLEDFTKRIGHYMELHQSLQRRGDPQRQRETMGENQVSQQALAMRIRVARSEARQGDIFSPAITEVLRKAMNAELRGDAASGTRDTIRDDAPAAFVLGVNDSYPHGASLATMPGNVLKILPVLPEGIEYRIVGSHLILRDVDADIVVDYIENVMCVSC